MIKVIVKREWSTISSMWKVFAYVESRVIGIETNTKKISEIIEIYADGKDYQVEWPEELKIPNIEEFTYEVGHKSHIGTRDIITIVSKNDHPHYGKVWVELRDSNYKEGVKRFNDGPTSTKELAEIILAVQEYWLNANNPEAPDFQAGRYSAWVKPQPIVAIGCANNGKAWRRVSAERVCDMLTRHPKFHEYMKSLVNK